RWPVICGCRSSVTRGKDFSTDNSSRRYAEQPRVSQAGAHAPFLRNRSQTFSASRNPEAYLKQTGIIDSLARQCWSPVADRQSWLFFPVASCEASRGYPRSNRVG